MQNKIAKVLKIIAWWTFGIGCVVGLMLSNVETSYFNSIYDYGTETVFSITILIAVWGSSFISGMLFLGFAEIIELLHKILNSTVKSFSPLGMEEIKKQKDEVLYTELVNKLNSINKLDELKVIKSKFESIKDFNDVDKIICDIDNKINFINLKTKQQDDLKIKEKEQLVEYRKKRINNLKSQLTKRSSIFVIVVCIVLSFVFINYFIANKTKLMIENWQGRWHSVAGNSFSGRLDIDIEKGLIGICNTSKCTKNIEVHFDKYEIQTISFKIDGDVFRLISRDDELVDLMINDKKVIIERFSSLTNNK